MTLCEVYTKYCSFRNMYNEFLHWAQEKRCRYAAERWYLRLSGALTMMSEVEQLSFEEYEQVSDELSKLYYELIADID